MKNYFLIITFFFLYCCNVFSQTNKNFLKTMEGKWDVQAEDNRGFEIWTKTNKDSYKIEEYKIFGTDTITFGEKQIIINKNIIMRDFGFSDEKKAATEYVLKEIYYNCFSFENCNNNEIISLNYLILDNNKIYFWTETKDSNFICTDYILIKDE